MHEGTASPGSRRHRSPSRYDRPRTSILAPIPRRTARTAARVGFKPTPSIASRLPGSMRAAARKNTAEDRSLGITMSQAFRVAPPRTEISRRLTLSSAPILRNRISVWSRVATGSTTVVTPGALSPASRTELLTWALATGNSYRIGCKPPPAILSGG